MRKELHGLIAKNALTLADLPPGYFNTYAPNTSASSTRLLAGVAVKNGVKLGDLDI